MARSGCSLREAASYPRTLTTSPASSSQPLYRHPSSTAVDHVSGRWREEKAGKRFLQREKIKRGKQSSSKRLESFNTLYIEILQALKQRIIPKETQLNKFHLVEPEIDPDDKKLYTWMMCMKYKSKCKATEDDSLSLHQRPELFSDCDKKLLAELIQDLMGGGLEELRNSYLTQFLPFPKMRENLHVVMHMV